MLATLQRCNVATLQHCNVRVSLPIDPVTETHADRFSQLSFSTIETLPDPAHEPARKAFAPTGKQN